MFDLSFSHILVVFVLALIVLGPEKLPRVASQVGRWVGRARAMARQFREQLEEEVNLEQARKAQPAAAQPPGTSEASPVPATQPPAEQVAYPPTYSHAHPTDSLGRPVEAPATAPAVTETNAAEAPPVDPRQQDWVGGVTATTKLTPSAEEAAYAPSHERGT